MKQWRISLPLSLTATVVCGGCLSTGPRERMVVHREPWQMVDAGPKPPPPKRIVTSQPSDEKIDGEVTKPTLLRRVGNGASRVPTTAPADAVEAARQQSTQKPTPDGFIDAVQLYDYEPGAIYEVLATPGFVTVLRLRLGEQILHLAAGDTSRWLIETITSGVLDPQATLSDDLLLESRPPQVTRVSVLIKPRRPMLQTNLVVATTERTYLIDLRSTDDTAYHSVVEWTYPKAPQSNSVVPPARQVTPADATRNYRYLIKVPSDNAPPWTPVSVFDDGHRVHVIFAESIDDVRRPPLFVVGDDGTVRLVNYHVRDRSYIVHELFQTAELRLGHQRVVIERIKPKTDNIFDLLLKVVGKED